MDVECEECRRIAVFAKEEAGKVNSCPFCNGAIDVPRPQQSSQTATDSIARTRFSVMGFLTVAGFVSFLASFVFLLCFFLVLWALGRKDFAEVSLIVPILAGVLVGVVVALRNSYR